MESSGGLVQEQPSAAVALHSGTRLGGYELGTRLGVGSMGAVYEGVRTKDGKRVAIKVLSAELAKQPTARARFLEEGKLTARVRHPNIVEVIETGEDGDRAFLVMERLEGEDLAQRIRAGAMTIADAVDLLIPVCDAVVTAHRRGITHRDLKPSNIFLTVRDGRTHPMVLDFGIAKQDDGAGAREGQTPGSGPRVMFGTPYYLAPEQVADHRSAGPASDQYALGVILYECLTGERPYGGDDMDQLFKVIVAGNAPPPRTRRSEIPAELESVVLRAMSPKPGKRFSTVADFRNGAVAVRVVAGRARGVRGRARCGGPSTSAVVARHRGRGGHPQPVQPDPEPRIAGGERSLVPAHRRRRRSSEQAPKRPPCGFRLQPRQADRRLKIRFARPFSGSRPIATRRARRRRSERRSGRRRPHWSSVARSTSPLELSDPEPPWTDPSAKRRRTRLLAVAGAGAVSVICLIVVVASGGSDPRAVAPPVSTVQTLPHPSPEPSRPTPSPELAKSAPAPAPAKPTAVVQAPLPKSKPATVSPEPSPPVASSPEASKKKSESAAVVSSAEPKPARSPSTHVATGEPAAIAVGAKRQSAPAQPPPECLTQAGCPRASRGQCGHGRRAAGAPRPGIDGGGCTARTCGSAPSA